MILVDWILFIVEERELGVTLKMVIDVWYAQLKVLIICGNIEIIQPVPRWLKNSGIVIMVSQKKKLFIFGNP